MLNYEFAVFLAVTTNPSLDNHARGYKNTVVLLESFLLSENSLLELSLYLEIFP